MSWEWINISNPESMVYQKDQDLDAYPFEMIEGLILFPGATVSDGIMGDNSQAKCPTHTGYPLVVKHG